MLIEWISHPENTTRSDPKLENFLPWESSSLTNLLDLGTFSRFAPTSHTVWLIPLLFRYLFRNHCGETVISIAMPPNRINGTTSLKMLKIKVIRSLTKSAPTIWVPTFFRLRFYTSGAKLSHFRFSSNYTSYDYSDPLFVRESRISETNLENTESDGNLMETFIQRSSDLLSIVNKLKKNSTEINYDDDFEALAHDFIQTRMRDLLDRYVRILEYDYGVLWVFFDLNAP